MDSPEVPNRPFCSAIRHRRKKLKMTVHDMARRMGASPGYISRIETKEVPSAEFICRLAEVLGDTPENLLKQAKHQIVLRTEAQTSQKFQNALRLFRRSG